MKWFASIFVSCLLVVVVFHGSKRHVGRSRPEPGDGRIRGRAHPLLLSSSSMSSVDRPGRQLFFFRIPAIVIPFTTPSSTPEPSLPPTSAPTSVPTSQPTDGPTSAPTNRPTEVPTSVPTSQPTEQSTGAPTPRCRVFLSSTVHDGDLDGIDGADEKCNSLANDAGLIPSEEEHVFKAILFSDQENDPDYDPRIEFSFCSGGYFLVDSMGRADMTMKVADDRDDLFDPDTPLQNAIDYFEDGTKRTGTRNVWTGVLFDDSEDEFIAGDEDCYKDWKSVSNHKTGRRGRSSETNSLWLDVGVSGCKEQRRIYCAEQA